MQMSALHDLTILCSFESDKSVLTHLVSLEVVPLIHGGPSIKGKKKGNTILIQVLVAKHYGATSSRLLSEEKFLCRIFFFIIAAFTFSPRRA